MQPETPAKRNKKQQQNNDNLGLKDSLTEKETEESSRLYALVACIPECRLLFETLAPFDSGVLKDRYNKLIYLFSGTEKANLIREGVRRGLPFMAQYTNLLPQIEEEFSKFYPGTAVGDAVYLSGDVPPSHVAEVSTFSASVMASIRKYRSFSDEIGKVFPELKEPMAKYANDATCGCRFALRTAIQMRYFIIYSICRDYKEKTEIDALAEDPKGAEDKPALSPEKRIDGVGEVFECEANEAAFKVTMQEVRDLFSYTAISVDTDQDAHPGRWRIFLG